MRFENGQKIESAFVHIPKTAGTFANHVLRSIYGVHHVDLLAERNNIDATPSWNSALTSNELKLSLRLNPRTRSIAGHYLMPTPELRDCLPLACKWWSLFREPVSRLKSDYRHKCQIVGKIVSFEEWIEKRVNMQIKMLVGTESAGDCIDAVNNGQLTVIDQAILEQGLVDFFGFDAKCVEWLQQQKPQNVKYGSRIKDELIMDYLSQFNLDAYIEEEQDFYFWLKSRNKRADFNHLVTASNFGKNLWPRTSISLTVNRLMNRIFRNALYKTMYKTLRSLK